MRAVTSASNLLRRKLCPGSERLEAGLPEEDSALSREGTLLHSYYSDPKLDRSFLKPAQRDLLSLADKLTDTAMARAIESFSISEDEPFTESRKGEEIWVYDENGEKLLPGHTDLTRVYPNRKVGAVADQKFGFKENDPADINVQLRVYACAVSEQHDLDEVVVAISQPRMAYNERLTLACYTRSDVTAARAEIKSILEISRKPDSPLIPGDIQCRFCRAKLICPAFQKAISDGAALVPYSATGTVAKRETDAEELIARASDEQLDQMLVFLQRADFIKDIARDEARKRVAAGQLQTWQIGKASEIRKIADVKRAVALLALHGKLDKDEIFDCASVSVSKLEERLREKTGCTWQEARDTIGNVIGSLIEKEAKRPSLTRKKV